MSTLQRPLLGFSLSLVTVTCWGLLPLGLKYLLGSLDPMTITWVRFLSAGVVVAAWLVRRGEVPALRDECARTPWLFAAAVAGLVGNYVVYLWGLAFVAPGTAQLVVQLAPMTLMLGSLALFGERFSGVQWAGVAGFFTGLLLFFDRRLGELAQGLSEYAVGVGFVVVAAVLWGLYALAQKDLLKRYRATQILVVVYLAGGVLLAPLATPSALVRLDAAGWGVLGFCCLNTLLAYGAFAEAMAVWESSRVSAVLTVTPVATLTFSLLAGWLHPGLVQLPDLGGWALPGAALVVAGSMATALGKGR